MQKEILSEIDQMKYLFGYKAGKVISEQNVPQKTTAVKQQSTTKPMSKQSKMSIFVGELLKNASEGKKYFVSTQFPKSIAVITGKEPAGDKEFKNDVEISCRVFDVTYFESPSNWFEIRLTNSNPTEVLGLRIGTLDWSELYNLWEQNKIKIKSDQSGNEWIGEQFKGENVPLSYAYVNAILTYGENPTEQNIMDVYNFMKKMNPELDKALFMSLNKNGFEDKAKQLGMILNKQQQSQPQQ